MKIARWIITIALMCGCIQFGMWIGKHSLIIKDWYPAKNYIQFFKEDRGMKNPKIIGVAIKNWTLRVYASDGTLGEDGYQIQEDIIPIEFVAPKRY
jgi:hypothetical protein